MCRSFERVNEWPQVSFTLRSVAEELGGRVDFEIVAVDNWCEEVARQDREPDRCHDHVDRDGKLVKGHIRSMARKLQWLRHVAYDEKLSHWCAKRAGVEASTGKFLLFLDAHVVPARDALVIQLQWLRRLLSEHGEMVTLHLPLTYHILETHRLVYALVDKRETGEVAYTFAGYTQCSAPYEVPCMSTCGMMMQRSLYDWLGGWPSELGIYGGGEHFMNFVGAVCGVRKFIAPERALHHHGEKRGYHWNYTDHMRNRAIANYMFGDVEYLDRYLEHKRGRPEVKAAVRESIVETCAEHRERIRGIQRQTIDEWLDAWKI